MLDEEQGLQSPKTAREQQESGTTSRSSSSNNNNNNNEDCSEAAANSRQAFSRTKWVFSGLLLLLGSAASAAFLIIGIRGTQNDSKAKFQRDAEEFSYKVQSTWSDYEMFGLWIHESCFKSFAPNNNNNNNNISAADDLAGHLGICTRQQFRRLYEHVASAGLEFKAAQFLPNVTHDLREELENESRRYYQERLPDLDYQGILGYDQNAGNPEIALSVRSEQPFYFPVHYTEPLEEENNDYVVDFDNYSTLRETIDKAVTTWKPVLTRRLRIWSDGNPDSYAIILQHPGIPPTAADENVTRPTALSQIVIRMPSYLDRATVGLMVSKKLCIFDSTDTTQTPVFLGAVDVYRDHQGNMQHTRMPELDLSDMYKMSSAHFFINELPIADRRWTIVVASDEYQADLTYIAVGGAVVFASILLLTIGFHSHLSRVARINQLRSEAQDQKARHAREQATREQKLNEFMAHEVRNPLSSAISALSFVKSAVVSEPMSKETTQQAILKDINVMNASLQFINELLRNMLDVHRTTDKQMKLDMGTTDVARDVLQPVASILFMRGAKVDIKIDCRPNDLLVQSDRMRLKQIVLNLASNASKFVQVGFIRLRAAVVDGNVELSVEDSGPGIPPSKRHRLFARFQESLDSLNQGTGLGLSVCKNLSELLGADIYHDENFDSGIPGSPGTRFVLRLNQPALDTDSLGRSQTALSDVALEDIAQPPHSSTLPDSLSVLFVDDDTVLRKMFIRAVRRVAPTWNIQEASNGETALRMVDKHRFDVIFMDQYMASIEKQLLGTETVREMRSKGVESIICGLSANDLEEQFADAGANAFMLKPFPCEKETLRTELLSVLQ